jgi:hypothetical protein
MELEQPLGMILYVFDELSLRVLTFQLDLSMDKIIIMIQTGFGLGRNSSCGPNLIKLLWHNL